MECPARGAVCHKCEKGGHFSAQCFTKPRLSQVEAGEGPTLDGVCLDTDEGYMYLDTLIAAEKPTYWTAGVLVSPPEVQFKLDTGIDVTAISEEVHKRLNGAALSKSSTVLFGPNRTPLEVLGQFRQVLTYNNKMLQQRIYVIKGLKTNLLGLPVITTLQLAASAKDYCTSL